MGLSSGFVGSGAGNLLDPVYSSLQSIHNLLSFRITFSKFKLFCFSKVVFMFRVIFPVTSKCINSNSLTGFPSGKAPPKSMVTFLFPSLTPAIK